MKKFVFHFRRYEEISKDKHLYYKSQVEKIQFYSEYRQRKIVVTILNGVVIRVNCVRDVLEYLNKIKIYKIEKKL
jgi:hypothetical protein